MREDILPISHQGNAALQLELTGISYCDGSYHIAHSPGALYVFEYIEKGHGTLQVEKQFFYPRENDFYIAPGWKENSYYSSAENPWTKYWFNLCGPLVEHLLKAYSLENKFLFHDAERPGRILKTAIETLRTLPFEEIGDYMEATFFNLIRELSKLNSIQHSPPPLRSRKLLNYLRSNVMKPCPSLMEMSRQMGLSPIQTIRIFRDENGKTPYDYLLNLKIDTAFDLLRTTRSSIKEISIMLGFNDPYYFSRIFRQKTGNSPSRIRKSIPAPKKR